ncbi:MAG: GMC oxidoreductase [Thermoleophilaceae bacterium]
MPQSGTTEALMNVPLTAHILGGAVIGEDSSKGVIDSRHRVFGYQGLLVCDGSAVPANVGVNPSLTITAMTERAMSLVDDRPEPEESDVSSESALPRRTGTLRIALTPSRRGQRLPVHPRPLA